METKICTKCGFEKPLTEFNFRDKRKGTYRAWCKECLHKRKNELYALKYKERYKNKLKENKNKHRELIRLKIKELKSGGCIICGEKEPCCLDFHHVYGKDFTISLNHDVTLDTLMSEVNKCVILCANCHRKLHANKININKRTMEIKFKKLSDAAVLPVRAHKSDAGLDLTCTKIESGVNDAREMLLVYHTDLAVEIPEGYVGLIFPRSSIYTKSISQTNCVGVVDSNYRGEIKVVFRPTIAGVPEFYKVGERFAQLVIVPYLNADVVEATELSESERGEEGFGSTGNEEISAPNEDLKHAPVENVDEQSADAVEPEVAAGDENAPEQA